MKRILPPFGALIAFEAAARRKSFTRAGEELGVAQSAISRHVAQLEKMLGLKLFERVRKQVVLTQAGANYADAVCELLNRAEAATLDILSSKRGEHVLNIYSLATLASNWLTPRMPSFLEKNPNISFQISTYRKGPFDFNNQDCDVAIHYGEPSWPNGLLHRLFVEDIVLICSPSYKEDVSLRSSNDLSRAVLLQQTTRPDAWTDILAHLGRKDMNSLRGPRFDLYSIIIQAALSGLGVAAVPRFLVEDYLATGALILPFKCTVRSRHAYYVVYPEAKRNSIGVQVFRRWILAEARKTLHSRSKSA
jgi:LysR family transcriptional regulator, glycine cleavage system transcriptional activator